MKQIDLFGGVDTLSIARRNFHARRRQKGGVVCPCCDRHGQEYRRRVNAAMARALIWLCQEWEAMRSPAAYVDVANAGPAWIKRTNQHPSLAWWGLVERPKVCEDSRKKHTGQWRPTALGLAFAKGEATIPEWVWTYAGDVVEHEGDQVSIEHALGEPFDYSAVMRGEGG